MEFFSYILQYFQMLSITDVIDIIIVAYLFYKLIKLIRNTTASRLLKGILLLLVAMQVSDWCNLNVVNFIFRKTLELGFIAIVILFQPELRKMLEQVGRSRFSLFSDKTGGSEGAIEHAILHTVEACTAMSASKTGAIIVFERRDSLGDIIKNGTLIDAEISGELIMNIFYPKAPLHDGAMIVREGRVTAAGCVLPLSQNMTLSRELGTRHRAAVGMSEANDSVCVVVSEETGAISVADGGMLKRHLSPETLEKMLRNALLTDSEQPAKPDLHSFYTQAKEGKLNKTKKAGKKGSAKK